MKVAFSILNMPDGSWHWVARIWEHGLGQACTIYKADKPYTSTLGAMTDAAKKYSERVNAAAARLEAVPK